MDIKDFRFKYDILDKIDSDENEQKTLSDIFLDGEQSGNFIDNIFSNEKLFVLGEPGMGKTSFLKQLLYTSNRLGREATYIDLKSLDPSKSLEQYISAITNIFNSDNDDRELRSSMKTEEFHLTNSESITICLDAFDEVRADNIHLYIEMIKVFILKFPKVRIYIGARTYFFSTSYFDKTFNEFKYLKLKPFSIGDIKRHLSNASLSVPNNIADLTSYYANTILQVPRYLNFYILYVKENEKSKEKIGYISKKLLFDFFVRHSLGKGDKKLDTEVIMLKAALQKLAMVMQIYQSYEVDRTEIATCLGDINNNIISNFANIQNVDKFLNNSLLKTVGNCIKFDNAEIQEYLASCELDMLGSKAQVLYDLSINVKAKDFHPTRYNVLKFVLDDDTSLFPLLFNFIKSKSEFVSNEDFKVLLSVRVDGISLADRTELFLFVYKYFLKYRLHIDSDKLIFDRLCLFYTDTSLPVILNSIESDQEDHLRLKTSLRTLKELIKINKTSLSEKIKNTAYSIVSNESIPAFVRKDALGILSQVKQIGILKSLKEHIFNNPVLLEYIATVCADINPDAKFSVDVFLHLLKKSKYGSSSYFGLSGISKVKKKENLAYIFDAIATRDLIDFFVNDGTSYKSFLKKFLENVSKHGESLKESIGKFVMYVLIDTYNRNNSEFLEGLINILYSTDKKFIYKILKVFPSESNFFDIIPLLSRYIQLSNIKNFNDILKTHNYIVYGLSNRLRKENKTKEAEYIENKYGTIVKTSQGVDLTKKAIQELKSKLKMYLGVEGETYYTKLFSFYSENYVEIDKFITQKQLERIESLTLNILSSNILEIKDGKEVYPLVITKQEGNSTNYTHSGLVQLFSGSLKILGSESKVGAKISNIFKFRQNIINFIPFGRDADLQIIEDKIGIVTEREIKILINLLQLRSDDLKKHGIYRVIDFAKKSSRHQDLWKPFLLSIYDEEFLSDESRKDIIDVYSDNESILQELIIKSSKNLELGRYISNKILKINEESEQDFVKLLSYVKSIKSEVNYDNDTTTFYARGVRYETEYTSKGEVSSLLNISSLKYFDHYISLLKYSFDVYSVKNATYYYMYVNYLWDLITKYFSNIKIYKEYKYYELLEKTVVEYRDFNGKQRFLDRLGDLKAEYISYISKPNNISESIKTYNVISQGKYLNIKSLLDLSILIGEAMSKLKVWIESEGAYHFIEYITFKQNEFKITNKPKTVKLTRNLWEEIIQKTVRSQLDSIFLRSGLREYDIVREPQLYDNKRIDFYINYGFVTKIGIEIKLTHNVEISKKADREAYRDKLINSYVNGYDLNKLYFVALEVYEHGKVRFEKELVKLYENDSSIEIIGINCIGKSK